MRLFFEVSGWVATTMRQRTPVFPHRDIGAVVELPHQATRRSAELLVGRQVPTALDALPIQHGVIFAAHDEREACQIGDDGPCPILPIQPREPR